MNSIFTTHKSGSDKHQNNDQELSGLVTSQPQQVGAVREWGSDDYFIAGHWIASAAAAWEKYRELAAQLNRNEVAMDVLSKAHAEAVAATESLLAGFGQPGEALFVD